MLPNSVVAVNKENSKSTVITVTLANGWEIKLRPTFVAKTGATSPVQSNFKTYYPLFPSCKQRLLLRFLIRWRQIRWQFDNTFQKWILCFFYVIQFVIGNFSQRHYKKSWICFINIRIIRFCLTSLIQDTAYVVKVHITIFIT